MTVFVYKVNQLRYLNNCQQNDTTQNIMLLKSKMMAPRPSQMLQNRNRGDSERAPRRSTQTEDTEIAAVQNGPQPTQRQPMTLFVSLPSAKTIQLQIDETVNSTAILRRIVFDQTGLPPDSENSIILTHMGKSLTKFQNNFDASKYHQQTIRVSMVLCGGSASNPTAATISAPVTQMIDTSSSGASAEATLKKFMKFISSLSLTEGELKTLAASLNRDQTQIMSTFVDYKLDENQILSLLSRLSSDQIWKTLEVLKGVIEETNDHFPHMESNEGLQKEEIKAIIEDIDQKIKKKSFEIDLDDPKDQKIGQILVTQRKKCLNKLFGSLTKKQWDQFFFDDILQMNLSTTEVLFEQLQAKEEESKNEEVLSSIEDAQVDSLQTHQQNQKLQNEESQRPKSTLAISAKSISFESKTAEEKNGHDKKRTMEENLDIIVAKRVTWYSTLSESEIAKVEAVEDRPEPQRREERNAVWGQADTEQDTILQEQEFLHVMSIFETKRTEKDVLNQPMTKQLRKIWYAFFHLQNEDVDGVTVEDYVKGQGVFNKAFEIKLKESKEKEAPRAAKFWYNLRREQQMEILTQLTKNLQIEMLITPDSIITADQKVQLWDLIILNRYAADVWSLLSVASKISALKMLTSESQIKLWQLISEDSQTEFLQYHLTEQDQKNKFWSNMSYDLQDKALTQLSLSQTTDLLNQLNQENLCLTMSMHKNKKFAEGGTLLDLLTSSEKKLWVETFLQCGKSSVTDLSSQKFIDQLQDEQYDGFSSIDDLRPELCQIQVIQSPSINRGLITLADVKNEVKLHVSDDGSLKTKKVEGDRFVQDEGTQLQVSESTFNVKGSPSKDNEQGDDLPRCLRPRQTDEYRKHYREWKLDQVNPDPIFNEDKKSIISSFENINEEKGFWCKESFTITNRISRLYSGQDGHTYIFARDSQTSDFESREEQKEAGGGASDIQLHVFTFVKCLFHYKDDMKLLKNYEDALEKKFTKSIDVDLLAKFKKMYSDQYDHFKKNASEKQYRLAIEHIRSEFRDWTHIKKKYDARIDAMKRELEGFLKKIDNDDNEQLDEEEFKSYYENVQEKVKHYSGGYEDPNDHQDLTYELYSQLSEKEGVSFCDCFMSHIKIFIPTWLRLFIRDNNESSSHQTYKIDQGSHLGRELLKKEQVKVKKQSGQQHMDQAPVIIKNQGKLLLAYTSAQTEEGACLYFYDLQKNRTCAKVSKADLFIDCYPHQTDKELTCIRYIKENEALERSVDFKEFYKDQGGYYDVAKDDTNITNQSKIKKQGNQHDWWIDRKGGSGKDREAFVHVTRYEDKVNFQKSFIFMLQRRESIHAHTDNWMQCFQSYEEEAKAAKQSQNEPKKEPEAKQAEVNKTVTFKQTINMSDVDSILTIKPKPDKERKGETFVVQQNNRMHGGHWCRIIRLVQTSFSESELKTSDSFYFHGRDENKKEQRGVYRIRFDEMNKVSLPMFIKHGKLEGLFVSEKNEVSQFLHTLDKETDATVTVKLEKTLQGKKLWNNTMVSYPFLFYTGLTPECREIIVANLADTKQPQKIIQLPDGVQLQNFARSHLDDRIYFHAFESGSASRGDFELILRYPFRKREHLDLHDDICIRRLIKVRCNRYAMDETKIISLDFIGDKQSPSDKLFWVSRHQDPIYIKESGDVRQDPKNKVLLDVQRSSQNYLYWIEDSPSKGTLLRGVILISNHDHKAECTLLNHYSLGDAQIQSFIVETIKEGDKKLELVTLLDRDLNLHEFTVNEEEKSFQPRAEVRNIQQELIIDAQWLKFNNKPAIDFGIYKYDYKLFTVETLGVVPKDLDFIVFYNLSSRAFSMVDTAHKKYPTPPKKDEQDQQVVTWTHNCQGTDFRLMDCKKKKESHSYATKSYFIIYPAPESHKLDLFGYNGRQYNITTNFIWKNLFLAQFQYRDVHQSWEEEGKLQEEDVYWSAVDQTGQVKQLPLELGSKFKIIFSKQTSSGSMIILNEETKYRIVEFNLRGELVSDYTIDDDDILQILQQYMVDNNLSHAATPQKKSNKVESEQKDDDDTLILSKIFIESSEGGLYRIASVVQIDQEQSQNSDKKTLTASQNSSKQTETLVKEEDPDPDQKQDPITSENFSLQGAIKIPIDNQNQQQKQEDIIVLVFLCKSKAQQEQFQEAVFHIAKDQLCIFSPKFENQSIRIISIKQLDNIIFKAVIHKLNGIKEQENHGDKESMERDPFMNQIVDDVKPLNHNDCSWIHFKKPGEEKCIDIKTTISQYPSDFEFSLQLNSFQLTNQKLRFNASKEENTNTCGWARDLYQQCKTKEDCQATDYQNFLQISLPDRVFIYDLKFKTPKESSSCFDINFFVEPKNFVDLGFPAIWSKQKQEETTWRQVTSCHERNIFLSKDIIGQKGASEQLVTIIKNYSISDVQALFWLKQKLDKDIMILHTELDQTMVSFKGHTTFSIFQVQDNQEDSLKSILEFVNLEFRQQLEENIQRHESYQRRIQKILTMPVPKFANSDAPPISSESQTLNAEDTPNTQNEDKSQNSGQDDTNGLVSQSNASKSLSKVGKKLASNPSMSKKSSQDINDLASHFTTALENCTYQDSVLRDLFITLAHGSIIADMANSQDQMLELIENYTHNLQQFFIDQVVSTPYTEEILKITWPKNVSKWVAFFQSNQQIDAKKVQKEVDKRFKKNRLVRMLKRPVKLFEAPVTVKMLRTKWLLQDKSNFAMFSLVLQKSSSDLIFETLFMKTLIQGYWKKSSRIVILSCFLPWLIYLVSTLFLFENILGHDLGDQESDDYKAYKKTMKYALSILNLIMICYQFAIELTQLNLKPGMTSEQRSLALTEYFKTVSNKLDLLQLLSTAYITIANLPEEGSPNKNVDRIIAVFALFFIWFKLFEWLRLFESTGFYVSLLEETIQDIGVFVILFFIALFMFGSSMFMLQNNADYGQEHFIKSTFNNFLIDQALDQYMLSLGEFNLDGFTEHPQRLLCWIFFFAATAFTQICMLNMVIAIMADTYDKVTEKRGSYVMQSKLETMSEYVYVVNMFMSDSESYLFIVKQDNAEEGMDDDNNWEGGFVVLKKTLTRHVDSLRESINGVQIRQGQKLKEQIKSATEKTREDQRVAKATMDDIKGKIGDIQAKVNLEMVAMKVGQVDTDAKIDLLLKHHGLYVEPVVNQQRRHDPTAQLLKDIVAKTVEWFLQRDEDDQKKLLADLDRPEDDGVQEAELRPVWEEQHREEEDRSPLRKIAFTKCLEKLANNKKDARGVPIEPINETAWYQFFNNQNQDEEGISLEDFTKGVKAYTEALKADNAIIKARKPEESEPLTQ